MEHLDGRIVDQNKARRRNDKDGENIIQDGANRHAGDGSDNGEVSKNAANMVLYFNVNHPFQMQFLNAIVDGIHEKQGIGPNRYVLKSDDLIFDK